MVVVLLLLGVIVVVVGVAVVCVGVGVGVVGVVVVVAAAAGVVVVFFEAAPLMPQLRRSGRRLCCPACTKEGCRAGQPEKVSSTKKRSRVQQPCQSALAAPAG